MVDTGGGVELAGPVGRDVKAGLEALEPRGQARNQPEMPSAGRGRLTR